MPKTCYNVVMVVTGHVSKRVAKAAAFFANKLLTPEVKHNIIVNIKKTRSDKRLGSVLVEGETSKVHGFVEICDYADDGSPIEFDIVIDSRLDEMLFIHTLAHEFVHIKQYALGEMDEEQTHWCGEPVDSEALGYANHPWEHEAQILEVFLVEEFLENAK